MLALPTLANEVFTESYQDDINLLHSIFQQSHICSHTAMWQNVISHAVIKLNGNVQTKMKYLFSKVIFVFCKTNKVTDIQKVLISTGF